MSDLMFIITLVGGSLLTIIFVFLTSIKIKEPEFGYRIVCKEINSGDCDAILEFTHLDENDECNYKCPKCGKARKYEPL
jgi:hypothetical protein